jgi:hypothetical protein
MPRAVILALNEAEQKSGNIPIPPSSRRRPAPRASFDVGVHAFHASTPQQRGPVPRRASAGPSGPMGAGWSTKNGSPVDLDDMGARFRGRSLDLHAGRCGASMELFAATRQQAGHADRSGVSQPSACLQGTHPQLNGVGGAGSMALSSALYAPVSPPGPAMGPPTSQLAMGQLGTSVTLPLSGNSCVGMGIPTPPQQQPLHAFGGALPTHSSPLPHASPRGFDDMFEAVHLQAALLDTWAHESALRAAAAVSAPLPSSLVMAPAHTPHADADALAALLPGLDLGTLELAGLLLTGTEALGGGTAAGHVTNQAMQNAHMAPAGIPLGSTAYNSSTIELGGCSGFTPSAAVPSPVTASLAGDSYMSHQAQAKLHDLLAAQQLQMQLQGELLTLLTSQ